MNFKRTKSYEEWDSLTAKFSGRQIYHFYCFNCLRASSTHAIFLQGIRLPFGCTMAGNVHRFAWKLFISFLLRQEKGKGGSCGGAVSIYVVITQLAMAEAMPLPYFVATSVVMDPGLFFLNFLKYFGKHNATIWQVWEYFTTVGGLSVLPQIMWSTIVPCIPNSILPGAIAFVLAVAAVTMYNCTLLNLHLPRFAGTYGQTFRERCQIRGSYFRMDGNTSFYVDASFTNVDNFLNPDNIKGLSTFSMLLAMIGNGLMIPRALFFRDFMCFNSISLEFFFAATVGLMSWLGCLSIPSNSILWTRDVEMEKGVTMERLLYMDTTHQ
ncbi:hypothetical protein CRYUN_Cryun16bG0047300 [Craigia yunnanensis]